MVSQRDAIEALLFEGGGWGEQLEYSESIKRSTQDVFGMFRNTKHTSGDPAQALEKSGRNTPDQK